MDRRKLAAAVILIILADRQHELDRRRRLRRRIRAYHRRLAGGGERDVHTGGLANAHGRDGPTRQRHLAAVPSPTSAITTQTSTAAAASLPVPAAGSRPIDDMSVTETEAATGSDGSNDPGRYPQIFTNQSYSSHNITRIVQDHHLYYNSTTVTAAGLAHKLWTELASREDVHPVLSRSHRRATTVQLSFDFPFYGHPVRNVTVATGGFVYMGDFIHSWLAATQYVAPLMANFDTSISNDSFIKYLDNGPASSSVVSVSGVVAILSAVTLVSAAAVWVLYAYRNPHTASGQFLIRYRPSQWNWRRGEARYTAATIHM